MKQCAFEKGKCISQEKRSYTTDIVIVLIGYHDETEDGVNRGLRGTKNRRSISP